MRSTGLRVEEGSTIKIGGGGEVTAGDTVETMDPAVENLPIGGGGGGGGGIKRVGSPISTADGLPERVGVGERPCSTASHGKREDGVYRKQQ